ncbi:MAG: cupin domain-containing protein [Gammaproteobacteria bacterium]|nr:cupin domain-containing protein [Gammaproteobacteria bacterium]
MKIENLRKVIGAGVFLMMSVGVSAQEPDNATHIPAGDIMTVFEHLGDTIDQQIRVVDIGDDINVGVGILRRVGNRTEGEAVNAIIHHRVTEVYYVLSGSGVLVTGGEESNPREFPADNSSVLVLIGPSGSRTTVNGQVQTVSAGDVVVIPAGVPHAFRHIQDQVTYVSVRIDPDQTLPIGYVHPSLEE